MTVKIDSDNTEARAIVASIAQLCIDSGAFLHPSLRVEIRNDQISLHAPAGTTGPLIVLPEAARIPLDGVTWSDDETLLALASVPNRLSPAQHELLTLHVALYNATHKMGWFQRAHPMRMAAHRDEIERALAPIKPSWIGRAWRPSPPRNAAEQFLGTRVIQVPAASDTTREQTVLHPLIELANHHHKGANNQFDHSILSLAAAQPTESGECFAHYGRRRDVLDLALAYGYLDTSTPFAHSAPITVEIEGLGRVTIEGKQRRLVHPLDPPRVEFDDAGITLSHVCCHASHPERARTVLDLALRGALQRRGHAATRAETLATDAIRAIGEENIARLARLAQVCDTEADAIAAATLLAQAARRQAAIFRAVLGGPECPPPQDACASGTNQRPPDFLSRSAP